LPVGKPENQERCKAPVPQYPNCKWYKINGDMKKFPSHKWDARKFMKTNPTEVWGSEGWSDCTLKNPLIRQWWADVYGFASINEGSTQTLSALSSGTDKIPKHKVPADLEKCSTFGTNTGTGWRKFLLSDSIARSPSIKDPETGLLAMFQKELDKEFKGCTNVVGFYKIWTPASLHMAVYVGDIEGDNPNCGT